MHFQFLVKRCGELLDLIMDNRNWRSRDHLQLGLLVCSHVIISCISLYLVAHFKYRGLVEAKIFHILFDSDHLAVAVLCVAAFSLFSAFFVFARFSFGYFCGFYLYTVVLGYLWLNCFSDLNYNHKLSGFSAAASAIAFVLPALLISAPIRPIYTLSARGLEILLNFLLFLSVVTISISASYNFRLVSPDHIYDFRNDLQIPVLLNYSLGITAGAFLPFAYACLVMRDAYFRAAAVLLLLVLIYPISLSKTALFTPLWLAFFTFLSHFFRARQAVVMSLLLPIFAGVALHVSVGKLAIPYFSTVNFRMIATPSNALDIYSDYFSSHEVTRFCQISILKKVISCPYLDPLAIVMQKAYDLGNFNASLFATEGIASTGLVFAPISVLLCGFVIALGNRLSAGLPARFILLSGAFFPQILLNVPLTIALLTHGLGFLFLLWYVMPRIPFEPNPLADVSR